MKKSKRRRSLFWGRSLSFFWALLKSGMNSTTDWESKTGKQGHDANNRLQAFDFQARSLGGFIHFHLGGEAFAEGFDVGDDSNEAVLLA